MHNFAKTFSNFESFLPIMYFSNVLHFDNFYKTKKGKENFKENFDPGILNRNPKQKLLCPCLVQGTLRNTLE